MLKVAGGGGGVPDPLVLENDATFNDVSIGHGSGDVSSNTVVGNNVIPANTTGSSLTVFGSNIGNAKTANTQSLYIGRNLDIGGSTSSDSRAILIGNDIGGTSSKRFFEYMAIGDNIAQGAITTSLYNRFGVHIGLNGGNAYGTANIGIGVDVFTQDNNGDNNIAIGRQASAAMTGGDNNIGFGYGSNFRISSADYNTGIGYFANYDVTSGNGNVSIGYNGGTNITTGVVNTSIGYQAGDNITTGSYNSSIGYRAKPSSATISGQFTLGDSTVINLRCNDTTISSLSDARDKTEIVDCPYGLNFVMSLQPRQFKWQTRDGNIKDGKTRTGFIAQELLEACDGQNNILDLVMDDNPEKYEAKVGNLIPILVKAIQDLKAEIDILRQQLA